MTGFALVKHPSAADGADSPAHPDLDGPRTSRAFSVELRTVNSRFLDLSLRLPDELRHHEAALRDLIMSTCKRGKVEMRVVMHTPESAELRIPPPRTLQQLALVQSRIQSWMPSAAALSVAEIMRLAPPESALPDDAGSVLVIAARAALDDLLASRSREGARLVAMLDDRIAQLRQLAQQAAPLIPQLVEQQRTRFIDRWNEALGAVGVGADAVRERALTEATAFAIRIDIAEELTRLVSHLDEITRLLLRGGEIGKRLDFLIQELHREANTLGSKSALLEMTRISVDMKVLIEQMREQVQNIE